MATAIFLVLWLGSLFLSYRIGARMGRPVLGIGMALLFGPLGLVFTWLASHDHGIPVQRL